MANAKGIFISGIILSVVGIILFVISFALLPSVLREATNNAIIGDIIVDSRKSSRFDDWAGQQSIDNYYKQYYYAWNLTNPNEFLNGSKPIYKEIGPFNYKYQWKYSNITFLDNGNMVEYVNRKSYIYDNQDNESFDPSLIEITNINPAFLGLLSQLSDKAALAGKTSEELLFILGSAPQMNQFIQDLSMNNTNDQDGGFLDVAYFFNSPNTFQSRLDLILSLLNETSNTTKLDYFYKVWSNYTDYPIDNTSAWLDMLVSFELDEPLGITLESARMILNSSNQYSILNIENGGIFYWLNSTINDKIQQELAIQLNITIIQLVIIRSWYLDQFSATFTQPYLLDACSIDTIDYLGLCQLITTIPLLNHSLTDYIDYLSPHWIPKYPTPIEIPSATQTNLHIGVMNASQYLFSGEYSLLTIQGVGEFTSHFSDGNYSLWNIDSEDGMTLLMYIVYYLPQFYSENLIKSYYSTSGLIVTRNVDQWLWSCDDPLLELLEIENNCALQLNNTVFKPSTIFTGKNDTSITNQYYQYQQESTLSDIWPNGSINISGTFTETGQFPPLQSPLLNTITIFEENVLRPVNLTLSQQDTQVEGINTRRYYLQNNSFPIDSNFNNSINGFANLTGIEGLPIFISLWDMYEVPPQYSSNNIIGLNQTSYENAAIPLDLEPITGMALYYDLKLQINLAIPNNSNYFESSSSNGIYSSINIPSDGGLFLPSFKIGQTAQPSDSNINSIKSQFKQIETIKIAPVVVFAIFGGILLIAGIIMTVLGFKRSFMNRGYQKII